VLFSVFLSSKPVVELFRSDYSRLLTKKSETAQELEKICARTA